MSQLKLRETNSAGPTCRQRSSDPRLGLFVRYHGSFTIRKPAEGRVCPMQRYPSFSCFLSLPLSGSWGWGAPLTSSPGPAQGPSGSPLPFSKGHLSLPTAGRIFNKPKKPLGRLPARVPPVSIPMTASPRRNKLVPGFLIPACGQKTVGQLARGAAHAPSLFGALCCRRQSCLRAASSSALDWRLPK